MAAVKISSQPLSAPQRTLSGACLKKVTVIKKLSVDKIKIQELCGMPKDAGKNQNRHDLCRQEFGLSEVKIWKLTLGF